MRTKSVIRRLSGGFERIDTDAANAMLKAGRAMQPSPRTASGVYYEIKAMKAQATEDLDSVVDEAPEVEAAVASEPEPKADPQTYETRDLTAQPRRRKPRRKTPNPAARSTVDEA